jgi:hypothetical protein
MVEFTIETPTDVDRLLNLRKGHGKVVIRLPSLAEGDRLYWESRLTGLANACGCEMGAAFLFATLIGYSSWGVLKLPLPVDSTLGLLALGSGIAGLGAIGGKAAGLLLARWRFRRAARDLEALVG